MLYLLLTLGIFGLITSTVYSAMVVAATARFLSRRDHEPGPNFFPPVSVLKAVHGNEPDLEANLSSFFEQSYPDYEILFCARHLNDEGLAIARKVAAKYPNIPCSFHASGEPEWPNARTYSLETMRRAATAEILVMTDSDVRVGPDFLARVVQPLWNDRVGLVTCLYRGVTRLGIWSRLEALGMSVEMASGVLVAEMMEGMRFALGPVMVTRKETIRKIGGLAEVANYHADDFILGNWVYRIGETVILSTYPVEHHVMNSTFAGTVAHQLGWATSTRFSRPKGHAGTVLTFSVPFGILAFATLTMTGHSAIGIAALLWAVVNRMGLSLLVGGKVVSDRAAITHSWLYPVRDLAGFAFWVASYLKTRLRYRGELFEVKNGGALHRVVDDPSLLDSRNY